MKTPTVSMVIPVYNGAAYLEAAIASVLGQSHRPVELIVVDDGSTDSSADIAAGFRHRLRLIRQANAGQSKALAAGWAAAGGELLAYLSADDLLRPEAIGRAVDALASRPEVVLVYPDFDLIDADSNLTGHVAAPDFSRHALYAELSCLPGPGAVFRRAAYERTGPWRSDLRQIPDLEFFLRLALQGDFLHISETLASFRRHPESTTYRAAPYARGEEPLAVVESFYRRASLPADVLKWQRSARASALYLSAAIHAQSGRAPLAIRRLLAGAATSPASLLSKRAAAPVLQVLRIQQLKRAFRRSESA